MSMRYAYDARWNRVESCLRVDGADVFEVHEGHARVVDLPDGSHRLEARRANGCRQDADRALPGISVECGVLTVPVEAFVPLILERLTPEEVAVELWSDRDVRIRFVDEMTRAWGSDTFDDGDRKRLLEGVRSTLHHRALRRVAEKIAEAERKLSERWYLSNELRRVNQRLVELGVTRADGSQAVIADPSLDRDGELSVGGASWERRREMWRAEVKAALPTPDLTVPELLDRLTARGFFDHAETVRVACRLADAPVDAIERHGLAVTPVTSGTIEVGMTVSAPGQAIDGATIIAADVRQPELDLDDEIPF